MTSQAKEDNKCHKHAGLVRLLETRLMRSIFCEPEPHLTKTWAPPTSLLPSVSSGFLGALLTPK